MPPVDLDEPRYETGLIHDHQAPEVPDLGAFAIAPIPTPPGQVALIKASWPMANNGPGSEYLEGDCTVAGALHIDQAGALIATEPWSYCGDKLTHTTYRKLTGGADTGLMLPQVLKPWHAGPFLGAAKNGGYAVIHPKNTTAVKQSIWIFGNGYVAVNLPSIAQKQFRADGSGVWRLTHTSADHDIDGGHCIVAVAYSAEGVYCITWGGIVLVTWEWWATYVVQVYAVVPPAFEERGGDARGYNLAAIDGFLPKV